MERRECKLLPVLRKRGYLSAASNSEYPWWWPGFPRQMLVWVRLWKLHSISWRLYASSCPCFALVGPEWSTGLDETQISKCTDAHNIKTRDWGDHNYPQVTGSGVKVADAQLYPCFCGIRKDSSVPCTGEAAPTSDSPTWKKGKFLNLEIRRRKWLFEVEKQ